MFNIRICGSCNYLKRYPNVKDVEGPKKVRGIYSMKLLDKIPKKALVATAAVGTAIAVGVAIVIPKEETYRAIQVYEIDGTAQVTREDIGQMDAYVNMQLQSNDQADTGSDSYVQMKMVMFIRH